MEIEAGQQKPADGEILEHMPRLENTERLSRKLPAWIDRRLEILVLQRPIARNTQAGATKVRTRDLRIALNCQCLIDKSRHPLAEGGGRV